MEDISFSVSRIIVFLINTTGIWLALWVFLNNRKGLTSRLFFVMTVILTLWVDLAVAANFIGHAEYYSLLMIRLDFALSSLLLVSMFLFVLYFPNDILLEDVKKRRAILNFSSFLVVILFLINFYLAVFTPFLIENIIYEQWGINIILGKASTVFYLNSFLLVSIILYFLGKKYVNLEKKDKLRITYFLVGIFIFIIANIIFNIVLPQFGNFQFALFGHYSVIFFLVFIAYAIVRQHLFGVKIILTALLVGFIVLLLSLDIFIFTNSLILQALKSIALIAFLFLGRDLIMNVMKEDDRLEKIKKLNEDLVKANDSLKELIEMKTSFLHIVSHQLRTPLTAIRGFLSMWQEGDFDSYSPRKMSEIKKRIANNVERLNNLVNDMVVAMESAGGLKLTFVPVDVEDIIKTNIEFMNSNYEKKKLYLRYRKIGKALPKIEADPKYLGNAFMNLIDNAEKYTQKGGLKILIEGEDDRIKIDFTDTGVGVRNEEKKLLFKKFSRGSKSRYINPNGSGLGLYIIKQIIKLHHGKVGFKSDGEGKGTTFTVTLPVKQPVVPNLGGPAASNLSGPTPAALPALPTHGPDHVQKEANGSQNSNPEASASDKNNKAADAAKDPPAANNIIKSV